MGIDNKEFKPIYHGIGLTPLPADIVNSKILTAPNLVQLASVTEMPFVDATFNDSRLKDIIQYYSIDPKEMEKELHYYAQELLSTGNIAAAWQILLALN